MPHWLLCRQGVSFGAKLCYALLHDHKGNNYHAWPGEETLAEEMGIKSARAVRKYVRELRELGLIVAERKGLRKTNRYSFPDHPWIAERNNRSSSEPAERHNHSSAIRNERSAPIGTNPYEPRSIMHRPTDQPTEFDAFYDAYPKKQRRNEAERCWNARIAEGVKAEDMIRASQNYGRVCADTGRDMQYVMYPSSFLGPQRRGYEEYLNVDAPECDDAILADTADLIRRIETGEA